MKKEIEEIKELITRDNIDDALEKTKKISSLNSANSLIIISSRYQNWKRNKRLGLGDDLTTRNSIIIALLDLVTQIENDTD